MSESRLAVVRERIREHPIMISLSAVVTLAGTLFHWAKDVLDWISRWDTWNAHASEAIRQASIEVARAPVWTPEACYLAVVIVLATMLFRRSPRNPDTAINPPLLLRPTPKRDVPTLEAVDARLCWVVEDNGGYAEWDSNNMTADSFDNSLRALVAVFRHQRGPRLEVARARIAYVDGLANVVENVDYGCWLGEDVNWADFDFGDTKYLVVAFVDHGQAFGINDNRRGTGASGTTARPLPEHTIRAYVTVLLLDGEFVGISAAPIKAAFDIGFSVTGPRISLVDQPSVT